MRIRDWSSDLCSSDLLFSSESPGHTVRAGIHRLPARGRWLEYRGVATAEGRGHPHESAMSLISIRPLFVAYTRVVDVRRLPAKCIRIVFHCVTARLHASDLLSAPEGAGIGRAAGR